MRDSKIFDEAVTKFFGPIAWRLGLTLSRVQDGIYDIPSPYFIMRVRLDTGHARGLNVTLRPASVPYLDDSDYSAPQYGLGCFMQYHGENLEDTFIQVDSDESFRERARLLAAAAERYGVPYLVGQGTDWDGVKEMVEKRNEQDSEQITEYKFPSFVRKRWHLPKP